MYRFHWLERMEFEDTALVLYLAAMLRGAPDGGIGVPLEVRDDSPRYRVCFTEVGSFKTVPEMFNEVSEGAERLEPFLFRETSSAYLTEMTDAMWLGRAMPKGCAQHYAVYAENVVTHVLAGSAPKVFGLPSDAP